MIEVICQVTLLCLCSLALIAATVVLIEIALTIHSDRRNLK